MVHYMLSHQPFVEHDAQGYVVFCTDTLVKSNPYVESLHAFYAPLNELVDARAFAGKAGSSLAFVGARANKPVYGILLGLGDLTKGSVDERLERYRRAIGTMIRVAEGVKISRLVLALPDADTIGCDVLTLGQETIATAHIASYHFDQFITDESRKLNHEFTLTLRAPESIHAPLAVGCERGTRIGHAVNQARQWCDLPANILNPRLLAEKAEGIARAHGLGYTLFTEEEIVAMGMGGLAAVSKGSQEDCRLVILEYRTEVKNAPTIALVGKGITFDSGGLSIKPAKSMETMKDDMSGAAVVLSTMEAIAHLKPRVNVIALAPIAENMPSGSATRPGDIVSFYNGKTAEIKNTDAEGRLVLADALSYAVRHYTLDAIIDIATLTGACSYALGPFFAGLMSQNELLAERVKKAASYSGDRVWPLPMSEEYRAAVRADVADLCNSGSERYRAGAIAAAFFLSNFVGEVPWVHIDSAGTAYNVPDISYYRPGGTGFGVRLLVELVSTWGK